MRRVPCIYMPLFYTAVAVFCFALPYRAHAELYVAGQAGYTLPNDMTHVQLTGPDAGPLSGLAISDLSLKESIVYGGKLGFYLPQVRWLGFETELFHTSPHIKQQNVSVKGLGLTAANVPGFTLNVTTWAVNAVIRYPGKHVQPYAGAGFGLFFAEGRFEGGSDNDTAPGINALADLRLLLTDHVGVFAEYKYNWATLDLPNVIGLHGHYSPTSSWEAFRSTSRE